MNWTVIILKIVEMILKYMLGQEDQKELVKEKISALLK